MDTEQVNEILRLLKIIADSSTANKIAAISMIVSGKLRAHFYTGNYICLYRATCGAIPDFEEFQSGNIAKS